MGKAKVYRSDWHLQGLPGTAAGGETDGAGCRMVGEERLQLGFTPPVAPSQRWGIDAYSIEDAG